MQTMNFVVNEEQKEVFIILIEVNFSLKSFS